MLAAMRRNGIRVDVPLPVAVVTEVTTLNASPPEVLREPDSSFAVMVKDVAKMATPAVMVATGVPIDFVASVVSAAGC
jgi:hypothetical protein